MSVISPSHIRDKVLRRSYVVYFKTGLAFRVARRDVIASAIPSSMLLVNNPWDKEVRRLVYDTSLFADGTAPYSTGTFCTDAR
jgi:hypothetical protein